MSKRFKITGTGKVVFRGAGKRHLLQGKSSKRRRSLRKAKVLGASDLYRVLQNMPFSTKKRQRVSVGGKPRCVARVQRAGFTLGIIVIALRR